MDKGSVIGIPLALASIIGCLLLEGGTVRSVLGGPALMIVIGGALGACMLEFPFHITIKALIQSKTIFLGAHRDYNSLIEQILKLAATARKDGLLALEKERETISDPLLKEAVKYAVDGLDPNLVQQILESRIDHRNHENVLCSKFWKQMGAYAPTVAIVGAVLGLIIVMQNLDKPEMIGPGIAVAFIATVYGVTFSNVFFLPMGGKLAMIAEHEGLYFELIKTGVRDIQMGTSPSIIQCRLAAILDEEVKEDAAA